MSNGNHPGRSTPLRSAGTQRALETLAGRLRELRVEAGLTGRDLARAAGWHSSKVSRIEHARQTPSIVDVRAWCVHCQAGDRGEDLVASLRAVDGMWTEWRRMKHAGLRALQESIWPRYERTARFHIYTSWLIPGLLQTHDYTRAILQALSGTQETGADIDAAVMLRMDRQRVLHQRGKEFSFLVEESVLRAGMGGVEVMTAQLGHLLVSAALPSVSLGIVPAGPRRDAAQPVEDFYMFDGRLVAVELVSGYVQLTQPYDLALYARTFADLSGVAVSGASARRLITSAIDALSADDGPPE